MPGKGKGPGKSKGKGLRSQDVEMARDSSLDQASQPSQSLDTNQDASLDQTTQSVSEPAGETLSQGLLDQLRSLITEELHRFRTAPNSSKEGEASVGSPDGSPQEYGASGSGASGSRDSAIGEPISDLNL